MAMGSSLSPVVINVYMEFFKDMAMKSAVCKPSLWLNTWITLLSSGNIAFRLFLSFLYHLNNSRTFIIFTEETDVNGHLPFLAVLIIKKEGSLTITVHRKPTLTGRYIRYNSNQPTCVK
jgi:hypothetical protein